MIGTNGLKARHTAVGLCAAMTVLGLSACGDAGVADDAPELEAANAAAVDCEPTDPDPEPSGELCELKPHQVGILGDSYIHLSGDFTKFLQENARKAGALGANQKYLQFAMSGASLQRNNLLANAIPTQLPKLLTASKRQGPEGVKLVVMTGGGNDVLIDAPQCKSVTTPTAQCTNVVAKSGEVAKKLLSDMAKAGIEEVIYFWYPDLGPRQGKVINDYAAPRMKEICESHADISCHFVDIREDFRGHPEYITGDNIHPTAAGSRVIANKVWDVMVDNCIGSK